MGETLEGLMRGKHFDEALRRIESGELDPTSYLAGIVDSVESRDPRLVKAFLEAGADPNHGCAPSLLHRAADNGATEAVDLLLRAGADPNIRGGGPALQRAVRNGYDRMGALLVKAGARDDGLDGSLLVWASYFGCEATVWAMLDAGFDIEGRADIDGEAESREAEDRRTRSERFNAGYRQFIDDMLNAEEEDPEDALDEEQRQALLGSLQETEDLESRRRAPASSDIPPVSGPTFLFEQTSAAVVAAGRGHEGVVRLLADAGADLGAADAQGFTPWMAAERGGHKLTVALLESLGAPRKADLSPDTALNLAAEQGNLSAVDEALSSGAGLAARDLHDRTPLLNAIHGNHPTIVQRLIVAGADVEDPEPHPGAQAMSSLAGLGIELPPELMAFTEKGRSPLTVAAELDRSRCAEILISAGADVSAVDSRGRSCASYAATQGSYRVLEQLLAAGCNTTDHAAEAPPLLLEAALAGQADSVRALLQAGLDLEQRHEGSGALHHAAQSQDDATVRLLLEAGADPNVLNDEGQTPLAVAESYRELAEHTVVPDGEEKKFLSDDVIQQLRSITSVSSEERNLWDSDEWDEDEDDWPPSEMPPLSQEHEALYDRARIEERFKAAFATDLYQTAAREMAERCGSRPVPWGDDGMLKFRVDSRSQAAETPPDVEAWQQELAPRGLSVFKISFDRDYFLLPSSDPMECMRYFGVAGGNYDITNSQVMEFFRTRPAVITQLRGDVVAGRFDPVPRDLEQLAEDIYSLCPDTFPEGPGEDGIQNYARKLEDGTFFMWWD